MSIELITTDGIFALDGGEWEVTNNIWIVGDEREVVVFDAAHDHQPIIEAINGRRVAGIVLTHAHNDHINAAIPLRDAVDAPILLHDDDRMLWDVVWPGESPDRALTPGENLRVGGHEIAVLHTPGHSPGCCSFHDAGADAVFSGDTLFCGGPGATGRSFSDEPTILRSIRDTLLALPDHTVVHTGHGDSTTIGAERGGVLARASELGL
ncbi:MAG TPA: MBL fold metallo-hydrolase [Ilumatobacteraceae bacterium]|nr:MBL fold metallo-hydrolase [Ilumatobacteraceae bacterium]